MSESSEAGYTDPTPEQMDNLRAIIANIDKTLERFTDA